ncbi:sulfatase [Limibacter armeniacum]|uniref:sulfatase family protein n=1 Tax=Limibacter armeniacum TaxID=466084 RepID=UPI002FE6C0E2
MKTFLLIELLFIVCALYTGCFGQKVESDINKRPNIIFIMSDDHAQRAISAYDSTLIQTPNIDRIANEGALFTNSFVTNSICAPSRAVMLTGKFSHVNGKKDNLDTFDGSQQTFPKILQENGYTTAVIGKWHLKSTPQGFDYYDILIGQGEYYQPRFVSERDTTVVEGYVTDIITDKAIEFIEGRKQGEPFCLLYHHKAPHRPWMPNVKDLGMYNNVDLPIPASFLDEYDGRIAAKEADMRIDDMYLSFDLKLHKRSYKEETGTGGNANFKPERNWEATYARLTPEQKRLWDAHYDTINDNFKQANLSDKALSKWKLQRYLKDYLRCIKSVDDNICRLLEYLDATGLAKNTIVVYTSDQGFYLGEHGWFDKRFMYEQSMRTPLMVRYPNRIEAGTKVDKLVQNIDYAPTLLEYAGVDVPIDMQGLSLTKVVAGKPIKDWRKELYYHYYEYPDGWHSVKKHYGVRSDRYKLIHFYDDVDSWELYDLLKDPDEINNLFNDRKYKRTQAQMMSALRRLQQQYGDTITVNN